MLCYTHDVSRVECVFFFKEPATSFVRESRNESVEDRIFEIGDWFLGVGPVS